MTEETALFLLSDAGRGWLAEVAAWPGETTAWVLTLRQRGLSRDEAAGVAEVAAARKRARRRFPDADRLFFTEETLAQATSSGISAYHAAGLAPFGTVADLGCGVGMDAVALAEAGAAVIAIERDAARLHFARANAEARGVADRITFQSGDVTALDWQADAAYLDPARRTDTQRVSRHADRYEPPLSFLETLRGRVRGGAIKLSPALPDDVLDTLDARIEFLSEGRECKEACAWFGDAHGAAGDLPRAAVLLPERLAIPPEAQPAPISREPSGCGAYLFDPDPALIRASALGTVAAQENLGLISADDTYLTGDVPLSTSRLASAYRILDTLPYRPKEVGALLRSRGIGRLTVKKRHYPKEPADVHKELGLKGGGTEGTLVLVRTGPRFLAVLCEPVAPGGAV